MALSPSKIPWLVALAFSAIAGVMSYKACNQLPEKLRLAEAKYQAYRTLSQAQNAQSDAEILRLTQVNQAVAAENIELKKTVASDKTTISQQAARIVELQANEPATTPEIEAMPIVINLRAQVKELTAGFTLAQQTIAKQDKVILNLELTVKNMEGIITEWQAKFNREESLRLASENLTAKYKKTLSRRGAIITVKNVVIGCLVIGTVSGLVRN
jgi:hypothetical protein